MKLVLVLFSFVLMPARAFWDYDDSFPCLDINLNPDEEESILDSINLHYLDASVMVLFGSIALFLSLFIILSFLMYKQSRKQPGDLIFAISICEFVMTLHWVVSASYFLHYPDNPPENQGNFCHVNSYFSIVAASLEFLYNCSFCIYINLKVKHFSRPSKIPFKLFHFVSLTLAAIILSYMIVFNECGKSILGTCSIKAISKIPFTGPIIVLIYSILSAFTVYRAKKLLPKNNLSYDKGIFNYYILYTRTCSIIWSLLSVSYLIVVFNCMFIQNGSLLIFTTITNILKLGTPFVLTILRLKDPYLKFTLKRSYAKLKRRLCLIRGDTLTTPLISQENLFEDLSQSIKKLYVSTMVAGICHLFRLEKFNEDLIFDETCGYSTQITIPISDCFLENNLVNLPRDERTGLSGKLISHFPDIFQEIYFHDAIRTDVGESFNPLNNVESINNSSGADGGRGGELFIFSFDNKAILKTMTFEEFQQMKTILKDYKDHLIANPNSLLARIYGMFSLISNTSDPIYFILMKNAVGIDKQYVKRKFDMKGSTEDREVMRGLELDEQVLRKRVLKDMDFLKLEKKLNLEDSERRLISSNAVLDSEFLRGKNLMDYSLFVVIIEIDAESCLLDASFLKCEGRENTFYKVAIIDFLQAFNIGKILEGKAKRLKKMKYSADISSVNPNDYSKRFKDFVMTIIS